MKTWKNRATVLRPMTWALCVLSAIALIGGATGIEAAPVEPLSPSQSAAIRGAADRGDRGAMYALIFSAISQKPGQTSDILAEVVRLVPEQRETILSTVGTAFPAQAAEFATIPPPPASTGTAATAAAGAAATAAAAAAASPARPTAVEAPELDPDLFDETAPPSSVEDSVLETAEAAADTVYGDGSLPLWSGEGQLGAANNTGNTKNTSLRVGAEVVWAPGKWENQAKASYNFYNDNDETTERRLVASVRPLYNITERFFGWSSVRYVDDKNDGFEWTLTEALGPGYRLLNRSDLRLAVSAGPGLQQTQEKEDDGGNLNNEVVGVGVVNFEWTFVENATFSNNFGITAGAERTRVDNVTALTLKVFGDLAARLSYEVRHDTAPGDDKKKTDTTGLASIVYNFEAN